MSFISSLLSELNLLRLDAPSVATVLPQESAALIRHLEKTSPETLALAREWEDVVFDLARSQQAIKEYAVCFLTDMS